MLQRLSEQARKLLEKFAVLDAPPIIIAPPDLRRYVRAIFEHKAGQFSVLSFREIEPHVQLRVIATLSTADSTETQ